ncbi:MAG: histidine phosphatase family protein [Candidatus Colwellbacteria bacterium]|nr:histidine phosphatase family protein [Candidatus Colwellbacteria bacterium]
MLKIYLARHGQDEDNAAGILNGRRDKPLTEAGLRQTQESGQKAKEVGLRFDKVYASPLGRTRRTAKIIAEITNSPEPEVLDDLIERDFGIMTGQPHSKIVEMCSPHILKSDNINYFLKPEGAETFPELLERADRVLAEIREKHFDGNILLVTHSDFGKMIYTAYYKLNWEEVLRMFHFGNAELLELSEESGPEDVRVFEIKQHRM